MAKTKIGSNASFSGAQKGLTIIGSHPDQRFYAYSGAVSVNNVETVLIDSNSGKNILQGEINFNYLEVADEDFTFTVYLNGIVIFAYTKDSTKDASPGNWFPKILIPPLTTFKITAINITDTDARNMAVGITGRVYA